jgi:hypothetical protein
MNGKFPTLKNGDGQKEMTLILQYFTIVTSAIPHIQMNKLINLQYDGL